ncbi:MAG: protein translocase subunit SecF [Chloroflexi bacterium]|nr:protein translocase subunit SecF [Chloroflexota bacterium]
MDFAGKRLWFYLISLIVIIPGIVFLITSPGLKTGIDFSGGSTMNLSFSEKIKQSTLREQFAKLGYTEATIQKLDDNSYFIRTIELDEVKKNTIISGLQTNFPQQNIEVLSFDLVSPVVANETIRNAFWAVLAASLFVFLYILWAFRNVPNTRRYSFAAIVALLHDTIIILGIFSILGELMDIEVNTFFLFAIVTVIGYSINDTIVIFDRLRENITIYPNDNFSNIVNISLRESLGRSLNTSITLLITLMALLLFGGSTIQTFLLVLLFGVIVGTYSSIGVASQILVSWQEGDLKKLLRRN